MKTLDTDALKEMDKAVEIIWAALGREPELNGLDCTAVAAALGFIALKVMATDYGHDAARDLFRGIMEGLAEDERLSKTH